MIQAQDKDREIFQRAWIVSDIQKAMRHWIEVRGIGPFFFSPRVPSQRALFLGRPASFEISAAIAQAGDIQIELIQQHVATCPLFGDQVCPPQGDLHHIGVAVSDLDAIVEQYAALDLPPFFEDRFGETRYMFIDTRAQHGYLTEFIQSTPAFDRTRAMIRDAADRWNGDAPIRSFAQT
ncbi:VOC family protein (plasmid) [Sphingobium sp. SJ10-10]|uniref:VOC family protein n=1 Tax=unclassified Sphingobium TaxID=2611147 RepID=UPI00076FF683|nr:MULTISPECIES: VOC family protein [unclassified Sphingobium]AMK26544.1 methylmalonyl-CoA epimerase [Sphingobium sp. TKS]MEC6699568.1 VOC family protein [Sphingobium sp. SJ10-10]